MSFIHRQRIDALARVMVLLALLCLISIVPPSMAPPASAQPAPGASISHKRNAADLSSEQIKAAVTAVYRDGRIQRKLPPDTPPPKLPNWKLGWLKPVLNVLAWLLLAGLVLVLLAAIYLSLRQRFSGAKANDEMTPGEVTQSNVRTLKPASEEVLWGRDALSRADLLAQSGDFAQAIHVLLIGALAGLRRQIAQALPPSLTSREILSRIAMPEAAQAALSTMISMVELSRFGFRPVDASDYSHCRERFLAFAGEDGGRA